MKKTPLFRLILTFASLAAAPLSTSATVTDGVRAYEVGDYERAREEWLPYAALGNPNALYNLAQLYRMGRGVPKDYARAGEYYLRAAEKGHVGAQRNLGTLYYFGRTGERDPAKALAWLSRAAANGDPRAQNMVGIMYYNGEAVAQDRVRAYAWISLAAEQGLGDARRAEQELRSFLTPADQEKARRLAPGLVSGSAASDNSSLMVNGSDSEPASGSGPALKADMPPSAASKTDDVMTAQAPPRDPSDAASPSEDMPENAAGDLYRVQVGAYRRLEEARAAGDHLALKYPDLLAAFDTVVETADLGPDKGIYHRLHLRPFASRAAAAALCAELTAAGQGCFVVKAPQ